MDVKELMKDYRLRNGNISQAEMAERLEVSQQAYSKIERGEQEPVLSFIVKYKDVTGISLVAGPDMERIRAVIAELKGKIAELEKLTSGIEINGY